MCATAARHERSLYVYVCVCVYFVQIEIVKKNKCNEEDAKNSTQHQTERRPITLWRAHSALHTLPCTFFRHFDFSLATPQSRLCIRRGTFLRCCEYSACLLRGPNLIALKSYEFFLFWLLLLFFAFNSNVYKGVSFIIITVIIAEVKINYLL